MVVLSSGLETFGTYRKRKKAEGKNGEKEGNQEKIKKAEEKK